MQSIIERMREMEIKLLIIEYNKASQLDRSLSKTNLSAAKKNKFRKCLLDYCIELMKKIDDGILTNNEIRDKIRELKNIDNAISFGQAQKVINVCLKQYCFITKNEKMIKELDCPLDTITMNGYGIKNKRMIQIKETDYIRYQEIFYKENNGIRILKDCEYDENRIKQFITAGEI
jgi:hypothetical protein